MATNITDRLKSFTTNTNALATDLIGLLDQFIFLEGYTLRTHPIRPETTLPPLPTDDTPIAVQMYATSSLAAHLSAHDQELQTHNLLTTHIASLTAQPSVLQTANKIVDKELAALPNSKPQTHQTARPTSLLSKLATLRHLQQSHPHSPEFKPHIATSTTLTGSGSASPLTTLSLPLTTSWLDFADILTLYTQHPQTTAEEFPGDHTLKEREWYYQRIVNGKRQEGVWELGSEGEYRGMLRGMKRDGVSVGNVSSFFFFLVLSLELGCEFGLLT